jgi:hypothetical protein
LGAAVQSVRAFARLDFHELPSDFEALGNRELSERVALGVNAEARPALS